MGNMFDFSTSLFALQKEIKGAQEKYKWKAFVSLTQATVNMPVLWCLCVTYVRQTYRDPNLNLESTWCSQLEGTRRMIHSALPCWQQENWSPERRSMFIQPLVQKGVLAFLGFLYGLSSRHCFHLTMLFLRVPVVLYHLYRNQLKDHLVTLQVSVSGFWLLFISLRFSKN